MMSKRTTARLAATIALSYCLSILLIVLISGVIILRTILNPWYILSRMEHNGFIEQSTLELREVFITYGLGSGVERDIMAPLITDEQVARAAEGVILQKYGRGAGYNFDNYSNEIYLVLRDYAISQGFEITADIETGLRDLADLCADTLRNHLDTIVIRSLAQTQRYTRIMFLGVALVSVLSLGAIIIIPCVNRRVTRWIDGYLYALGATAIFCIAIPVIYNSTGLSTRLQITPMSYFMLITSWLDGIISGFTIALIPLILLIIVCVTVRVLRSKRRKKYSRRNNLT
jgi:hypothetical protein